MTDAINTITIPKPLFHRLMLFRFYYSLGGPMGIGSGCARYLTEYWKELPKWMKKEIHFKITEAIECHDIRPLYDINEWKKILELKIND